MHKNNQKVILFNSGLSSIPEKKIKKTQPAKRYSRFSYLPLGTLGFCLFLLSFHEGANSIPSFALNKCEAAQTQTETAGKISKHSGASQSAPRHSTSHVQLQQWLRAGKYAALEKRLNSVQEKYKKGEIDDLALRAAYRSFYPADPALASHYAAWIKAYPHSYAAHLAEGIYYIHVGRKARGDKYINKTSQAQIEAMDIANRKAYDDLMTSLKLDKKQLLSLYWLIDISIYYDSANPFGAFAGYSRHVGNQDNQNNLFSKHMPVSQRDLIDAAIRIAPPKLHCATEIHECVGNALGA